MRLARLAALTLAAGGAAVVVHVALASAGVDPMFPAAAAAACVALAGTAIGSRAGGMAGLFGGAALAWVKLWADVAIGPGDVAAMLLLAAIGCAAGVATDVLRRRLRESARTELDARRESYRLKREVDALTTAAAEVESSGAAEVVTAPVATPAAPGAVPEARLEAVLKRVASSLNESRLFATVLESAADVLAADRVVLHQHDRRADRFQDGTAHPPGAPVPAFDREPLLREGLRRRELLAREGGDEAFGLADPSIRFVAPVFDRVILAGLLVVEGGESTPGDRERLSILATAFGLALSSVRLAAQLEQRGRTDPLTGLPSVAEIRDVLSRSLERGRTAALLFAADGIREVNEKYGRKAGDKAVQALSKLLALEVGAEGAVGRYGGATMLVVLPGKERDGAVAVAERVLRRVPTSIPAGPEGLAKPLTASVGAAAATVGPVDALLGEAESALKRAQDEGGGRCVAGRAEGAIHA